MLCARASNTDQLDSKIPCVLKGKIVVIRHMHDSFVQVTTINDWPLVGTQLNMDQVNHATYIHSIGDRSVGYNYYSYVIHSDSVLHSTQSFCSVGGCMF